MKKKPRAPVLKVFVDAATISQAERRDSSHCMIADAVKKMVPGAKAVSVDIQTVRYTDPYKPLRYTYLTPRTAAVALIAFDQGQHTDPFHFTLSNGHVTWAGSRRPTTARRATSPEAKEKVRKAAKHATKVRKLLSKQVLRPSDTGHADMPVGGQPAPKMKLKDGSHFARRRAFGLRALAR